MMYKFSFTFKSRGDITYYLPMINHKNKKDAYIFFNSMKTGLMKRFNLIDCEKPSRIRNLEFIKPFYKRYRKTSISVSEWKFCDYKPDFKVSLQKNEINAFYNVLDFQVINERVPISYLYKKKTYPLFVLTDGDNCESQLLAFEMII